MVRHPAFWLGLLALVAGTALLVWPGRPIHVPPLSGPELPTQAATPPASATPPDLPPETRPSEAASAATQATDFQNWHRADLADLCDQYPLSGPVYGLLAEDRYSEAMQTILPQAENGDLSALGLVEAYRNLCEAFIQTPPQADFLMREQALSEGESPETSARITRYLEQERSSQEMLNQNCPELLSVTAALSARITEMLTTMATGDTNMSPERRRVLGQLLVGRSSELALQQLEKAAAAGDGEASYWLSQRVLEDAWRRKSEPAAAATALNVAAKRGSADAIFDIGQCALEGCPGIPANPSIALTQLRAAANRGHPAALAELIDVLSTGRGGIMVDPTEAMAWTLFAQHLTESGYFTSAYFEMRRQFRDLRAPLEARLSPEQRASADSLAATLQRQFPQPAPKAEACRGLLLPPSAPVD